MNSVRLSRSVLGKEEIEAVTRILEEGYLGMGSEVHKFEQEIKGFLGTSGFVSCVNSGTAALHLALEALGIGPGDEVLVPSITYVASFQAVAATGAKPVACDVIEESALIDLQDARRRLSGATRAIMPVHYASNTDSLEEIYAFAVENKLRVVEDAAHSFGCTTQGVKVGVAGDVVCFSFDGIKNITSGEGGAVVTNDANIARHVEDARLLGVQNDTEKRYANGRSWDFDVCHRGYRYHMSNIMAAIGRAQLAKIEHFGEIRRKLAQNYIEQLSGFAGIELLTMDSSPAIPHIFPLRVLNGQRNEVREALGHEGIETGTPYFPNHRLSKFHTEYRLPIAEKLGEELLSLPLHPMLSPEQQDLIINLLKRQLVGA